MREFSQAKGAQFLIICIEEKVEEQPDMDWQFFIIFESYKFLKFIKYLFLE